VHAQTVCIRPSPGLGTRLAHMESRFWQYVSGNTVNDIHEHTGAKQLGVKVGIVLILMQDLA